MPHAEPSSHDDARDADGLPAGATDDVGAAASAALDPPPHTEPYVPVTRPSAAIQSAIYEEPGADGRPVYRGFQDPKSQSKTFRKLQSFIESGSEGKRVTAECHCSQTVFGLSYLPLVPVHDIHFYLINLNSGIIEGSITGAGEALKLLAFVSFHFRLDRIGSWFCIGG